jgi:predicted permease
LRSASPEYFKTLGIPLIAGRTFLNTDDANGPAVVLLNQTLAKKHWGNESPIGKRITFDDGQTWITIVGIVGDVKEFGLHREIPYQIYRPLAQTSYVASALVQTSLEGRLMADQIRRALHEVEPLMAVPQIQTMEQARAKSIASPRTLTHLFALFAALALVISVAGIASMLSLWVRQRTRETGIRMALGATPGHIRTSVIKQGMTLVIIGLVLGLAASLGVTKMLTTLLFQIEPNDTGTFTLVALLLLVAAFLACYAPARRASKVAPHSALKL